MAPQDYISRSKNKAKKHYKVKAGESQIMPRQTKLAGFVVLVAVVFFGVFLWTIKDKSKETELPTAIQTTVVDELEKTPPAPPNEKWSYVNGLKNKEVEVGEYKVENKGPYKMQCASFRTLKQADVLKARIAFSGLEAMVIESKGKRGTYFKVVLGPYERKRQAEKDRHKLKSNNINTCEIWNWT